MTRNPHGRNEPARQNLGTPRWLVEKINYWAFERWGVAPRLDVCATKENAVCPSFWTEADDGLLMPWVPGPAFCNPPFSQTSLWLAKAALERERNQGFRCVFLLRGGDLQTAWVREHAQHYDIEMLTPRVNYVNAGSGANFPSMLWWYPRLWAHPADGLALTWRGARRG